MNKSTTDQRSGGSTCAGAGPKTSDAAIADVLLRDAAKSAIKAAGAIVCNDTPAADAPICPHCGAMLRRGLPVTTAPDGTLRVRCVCGETVGMDVCPLRVWRIER